MSDILRLIYVGKSEAPKRDKNETAEQRKGRKALVKEAKKIKRETKKQLKVAFKNEGLLFFHLIIFLLCTKLRLIMIWPVESTYYRQVEFRVYVVGFKLAFATYLLKYIYSINRRQTNARSHVATTRHRSC